MLATRVIPTLLMRNTGLVKGVKFKNHKYVGDPVNAVKIFNDKEADELIILDINATVDRREPNYELIADIASQAFMPFAYGGGINTIEQIEKIFRLGVEKIILNSAACNDLQLVSEASSIAGSQSIVVSIDVKKSLFGKYKVFSHSNSINTGLEPIEFATQIEKAGAGEIMVTSIDNEGTGNGYDYKLIQQIADAVTIPVIASGGAGSMRHLKEAVDSGASAVAAGSLFTFHGKHRAVLITYPEYQELKSLFRG
ncbi:imidazole glycerol phosphate synthase subunit HisF [Vibrio sp. RE86]|uniref:AglZ/HisF2 family acetamidino modification protein n=1 Tax=Vibrio sp. RE86 TaxID=2607605 RepID=UPI001493C226|nr:AglZ/HisF2 family acetamidino modification protein [Vibrio sp. RE86]NOH80814.1 imidazole glycerol phosphate synthase subunit HisF [Vibrio sp. RE86]